MAHREGEGEEVGELGVGGGGGVVRGVEEREGGSDVDTVRLCGRGTESTGGSAGERAARACKPEAGSTSASFDGGEVVTREA